CGLAMRRRWVMVWLGLTALGHWGCGGGSESPEQLQQAPAVAPVAGALVIQYTDDSSVVLPPVSGDSILALDWLLQAADSAGIAVETKEFPYGILVNGIGHRQGGDGGYWLYDVNGAMVPKAASSHKVAWSDTLRFIFDER
ncbi:MAG TPA: DUF4430 domain-containing protein, partial [candidate division Zixibacteria bacterium]|nr:DUF4430 domain-containing protein [candidate division Zixibacteria bacterium]